MLFRKQDGSLVEINRLDFKNDSAYYHKVMDLMMETKIQKKETNVLNSLNSFKKEKEQEQEQEKDNDDFVNAKIGNLDRILQKL